MHHMGGPLDCLTRLLRRFRVLARAIFTLIVMLVSGSWHVIAESHD